MPTYQYACRSCGHRFEIVQSMADEPLTTCPECGGELRKVYAPPAIAFRGSGFYATDHGKRAAKKEEDGGTATKETPAATAKGSGTSDEGAKRSDAGAAKKGGTGSSKPPTGTPPKKREAG